ncbi:RNA polymerase sigma-70 factor (ECF subfamily) [Chitinophaga dinghuensis]|uniref:RNA polymerase sigma-70 factor (ECF subfamily) n=1 Tax=Chitinophaga dinghuensis TaxID=1539050 RepID=A0A327VWK6_9BACT|nr:RNA polymerase sigma-70 factor [Chitinophaga dinghuensis]RAJ80319.1 RNA polymerase sigma-70 factor (ECF subfamily) [Chitinophaga dinghuensis]
MSNEEAILLEELRKGSKTAFIALYNQHYRSLYSYILHFIAIPQLAEDALQEVFIKVWEIRERIDPERSFTGYMYRITRNHVFKLLKKIAADEELRNSAMIELHRQTEDPDTRLLWKQYEALLREAVTQLPPQRQRVFRLCREESKSYEEVAAELGISRNTVKEHMVLALKSIQSFFYEHADGTLLLLLFTDVLINQH